MEEDSDGEVEPVSAPNGSGPATAAQGDDPTNILFIEGLPHEVTAEMLNPLFQQCVDLCILLFPITELNFRSLVDTLVSRR